MSNQQQDMYDFEVTTLQGHKNRLTSLTFSSDSRIIASASSDSTLKLWDVMSGQLINTLTERTYSIINLIFSPDNQTIASASRDYTVRLWKVTTDQLINTLSNGA